MSFISSIQGLGSSFLKNVQPPGGPTGQGGNEGSNAMGGMQGVDFTKAQSAIEQLKQTDFSKAPELLNGLTSHLEKQNLIRAPESLQGADFSTPFRSAGSGAPSMPDMFANLVEGVNAKGAAARAETAKLMSGETDNIHQSIIAMQEAGVAFSLLVEVRNKLVESYQELMRMQV